MKRSFLTFPNFLDKAVTLSYDDGVKYDKKLIEIMKKNGLKGTFNINSGLFASEENANGSRMTKQQAFDLYSSSGMEVAVHGYRHLSLSEVDSSMAVYDVINDRKELEEIFGGLITGMAYANGAYSDAVVEILKACGITYSRTVATTESFFLPTDWLRWGTTCHHKNPKLMELANAFFNQQPKPYFWSNYPKLFYLWGHSYEFNNDNNWNVIEEFAEFMGNRDDVWYATNGEIYKYVSAYDNLKFSANGTCVYNPSAITVYINYFGKHIEIKPGETVGL